MVYDISLSDILEHTTIQYNTNLYSTSILNHTICSLRAAASSGSARPARPRRRRRFAPWRSALRPWRNGNSIIYNYHYHYHYVAVVVAAAAVVVVVVGGVAAIGVEGGPAKLRQRIAKESRQT